jgi:transposase
MRRHDISSGLLYHWKDQYTKGRFDNPPNQEAALEERVRQLEQLVGKLTLENEFLKKAVQRGLLSPPKRSGASLLSIAPSSKAPKGGAS